MANTATAIYIDTSGTGPKQTGHVEFELTEAINYSPFTIELWYKHVDVSWNDWTTFMSITNTTAGADNTTASTAGSDFYLMGQYGGGNNYYAYNIYNTNGTGGGEINSDNVNRGEIIRNTQWHHVAAVRQYNRYSSIYHDGELISGTMGPAATKSNILPGKRVELGFNRFDVGDYPFKGYMDEVRISKKARYGNIDVPTGILSTLQNSGIGQNTLLPHHTKLLVQANSSTTTSTTLADQTGNHVATLQGDPAHAKTSTLSWANTAIYFDGDDNINFPASSDFEIWDDDFSIECWFKDNTTGNGDMELVSYWASGTNYWNLMSRRSGADELRFGSIASGTADYVVSYGAGGDNTDERDGNWHHIVVAGVNRRTFLWLDGQLLDTGEWPTAHTYSGSVLYIGCRSTSAGDWVTGWMDGVRICKGQSAYTPHFTPYGGQKNVAYNRGGAVTHARLASANTHEIQTGRAAIGSDAATNANTYCLDFNGTAGYLIHNTGGTYRPSDDRGTVFAWIYPDVVNADQTIFAGSMTAHSHTLWGLYLKSNAKLAFQQRENDTMDAVYGDTSLSAATWSSVAITSDGTTYALYVNGTAQSLTVDSGTNTGEWFGDTAGLNNIAIGAIKRSSAVDLYNGKIMQVAYFGSGAGTNGVLTAAQIAALHSAGKSHDLTTATGVYTASEIDDLKGYWRMGNHHLDTSTTIYDASGNDYNMHTVSDPSTFTFSGTTTFTDGWQHRGFFASDQYTSLLIQSSNHDGSTSFYDTGPGFKKMEFDGTNDVVKTFPDSADWDLGTGDFCVATWVKIADNSTNYTGILTFCDGTSASSGWGLGFTSGDEISWWNNLGSNARTVTIPSASYPSNGTWNFIVVSRTDNVTKIYLNGTEMDSQIDRNTYNAAAASGTGGSQLGAIGRFYPPEAEKYFKGQIAQLGFWKGSGLTASQISTLYALEIGDASWNSSPYSNSDLEAYYTFGNTTSESPADSGTNLYDRSTGSDQDLAVDGATAPFAGLTVGVNSTGTAHKTDKSVFGGSSMYFDGTDDVLQVTPAAALSDWTGDEWTVEWWQNYQGAHAVNKTVWTTHAGISSPSKTGLVLLTSSAGKWLFSGSNNGSSWNVASNLDLGGPIALKRWEHWAIVVTNGTTIRAYQDGVCLAEGTLSAQPTFSSSTFQIGGSDWANFNSYIDEFRISSTARYKKSIERYANTFVAKGDTADAFTAFQIDAKDSRGGDTLQAPYNFSGTAAAGVEVHKNIIWSNVKANPYGGTTPVIAPQEGGSPGEAWIKVPNNGVFNALGTEDWTYEFWWAHNKVEPNYGRCWMIAGYDDYMFGLAFHHNGGGTSLSAPLEMWGSSNGTSWDLMGESPGLGNQHSNTLFSPDNKWRHIVWQRKNKNFQLYVDGVLDFSAYTASAITTDSGGGAIFLAHANETYAMQGDYIDGLRFSYKIARYGGIQLRTAQQTVTSSNSDSGVITSNSTFGTANNAFETDGHTVMLLNGDELYANTLVVSGAHTFHRNVGGNNVSNVTTTFATSVQASVEQVGGGTGNVFTINGALRPTDLVLVRDNHYIFHISDSNYTSHPFKFSTTNNGTHSGGTEYTTGITVDQTTQTSNTLIKFSPTSATPDTLYYYCGSHSLMGGQITVTDSTGSDGKIATQPMGMFKGDGTAAAGGPTLRQGFSALGANSYIFDGTDIVRTSQSMVGGGTTKGDNFDFGKEDFTIEYWEYPTADNGDHIWHLGGPSNNAGRVLEAYYYGNTRFNLVYGLGGTSAPNFNAHITRANHWAHIAIQGRWGTNSGQLEVWKNGELQNTSPTFTTALNSFSTIGSGSPALFIGGLNGGGAFQGYFDSFRISKGIARYGYSGTNTKLGTNAVHHSQCKLLITSNTFHGNTHFDDFSDQGNYWNQQPSSYWFDNADSLITTPSTSLGTAHCAAAWINIESISTDGGIFGLSGSTWALHHNTSGVLVSAYNTAVYDNTLGKMTIGEWHLVAVIKNGATTTNYVNGVQAATNASAGTTAFDGAKYIGNLSSSGTNWFYGRIAQVAAWDSATAISAANIQSMWEAGPTANWMTDYSTNMHQYYAMGNHNDLDGRPADDANKVYDRSGNGFDGTVAGVESGPNKGHSIVNNSGVIHSKNQNNFGSSAIYFDNTSWLHLPASPKWHFDSRDFTVEMWLFPIDRATTQQIWSQGEGGGPAASGGTSSGTRMSFYMRGDDASPYGSDFGFYAEKSSTVEASKTWETGDTPINSWRHVALTRTGGKLHLYQNGKELSPQAITTEVGTSDIGYADKTFIIGTDTHYHALYKGYMDEFAVYHGIAKYKPVATGLGTSTITPSSLDDPSGNHFTTSGLTVTDQMLDTPENNFCTWNAIHPSISRSSPAMMAGEGNLKARGTGQQWNPIFGTMGFTSGKWYYETKYVTLGTSEPRIQLGWGAHDLISKTAFADGDNDQTGDPTSAVSDYVAILSWSAAGYSSGGGTTVGYATIDTDGLSTFPVEGDVVMFCADLDNNRFSLGLNGIWYGNINPADGESNFSSTHWSGSGTATGMRDSSVVGHYTPFGFLRDESSGDSDVPVIHSNFGQGDPDGENNYTDSNGRGGFRFDPPQGFLALCTANMKDSEYAAVGPNSAAGTPDKHFDTLLYKGNEKHRSIGGLKFKPDLVWLKNRERSRQHWIFDSVRGDGRNLNSDDASAEAYNNNSLKSFNDDGFSYGSSGEGNYNDDNFVAWCWKAGNETTENNDGTLVSTTSVNSDAGFSIVTYKGDGATGSTFGHGLSQRPDFVAIKQRTDGTNANWLCWHQGLTAHNYYVHWDTNGDEQTNSAFFTNFGASTITLGNANHTNGSGDQLVAYCWYGVEGFSKFGTYTGNANADGPFIYTGFRPAFIMGKNRDDAREWWMHDSKRDLNNGTNKILYPHLPDVEDSGLRLDMLSNGFKIRLTSDHWNESGDTFIYMAFAEMPFKYANAR